MKKFLFIMVILMGLHFEMVAQLRDSLQNNPTHQRGILPGEIQKGLLPAPDSPLNPDLNRHAAYPLMTFPALTFNTATDLLPGAFTTIDRLFPFMFHPSTLTGRSIWELYQGNYGIRTYAVNKNLYLGTAGFSDRSFNFRKPQTDYFNQTNFSSSLFVGYKFSEKFSISAGFTIQHYGNPLAPGHQNRGFFP